MTKQSIGKIDRSDILRQFSSIEEIIEDARHGKMFILVDAEDRENEGDLVIPAQKATPEAINFMAKHGRGLICLAMTSERTEVLKLGLMSGTNKSRQSTAFTVSIEAKDGITTGISAYDRAHTIQVAIDPQKDWRDIVSPGHVFPLVARNGGVLVRAGHTEAAVDIARLAGLIPAGVICEIMNDDGTMARVPDLLPFAQRHGVKIGTIADLIAYRRRHDRLVHPVNEQEITTAHGGVFKMRVYESLFGGAEHLALIKGDISTPEPVLVRMHAVNIFEDILGIGFNEERRSLIERAMRKVAAEGRGVIVLVRTIPEKGSSVKLASAALSDAKEKDHLIDKRLVDYGIGAQILLDLGVKDMILLSDSPTPKIVGLEGYGLNLIGRRPFDNQ